MEIKKQEKNVLFSRQEVSLLLDEGKTPSYAELKVGIAKKLKSDEGLVVVKRVNGQFGKTEVLVDAFVYDSQDALKKFEKEKKKAAEAAVVK